MWSEIFLMCVGVICVASEKKAWNVSSNASFPGLYEIEINNTESCLSFCYYKKGCFVVNFDASAVPPCSIQATDIIVDSALLKSKENVTNYILVNVDAKRLEQAPFNDVRSCTDHCFQSKNCYAVDFDTKTTPSCWIQTDPAIDADPKKLYPMETNTNFIWSKE
ncbi:hypothetical protein HELRODRAFT_164534 [Helobdella robusta]|uniref:Apple domain-containing protein n=1 Tax=Helobdella robusta TaxID=6412 RepID=T1EVJ0_HELRO|nr:hypothetical protein HELRODRAFT_164526 [Helobdella robusta]XP_009027691.1 hypothetical protein HELRODRAFT_164531 [Helobdella robusta]XP_009027694.1 hypothetical protein HELRODRAFT_164534 [Helobdella robusta]ESN94648.1 hypothetical protein HELRODRAFT_164526 [Helobdella robusta]ESN94652.1 hypothetical protein HELRODRAFT_164531 [Helobdella robusta]ESN94655.1 hypothetical protein HELRODRAFT_164534 [Helobdella robusta]